MNSRSILSLLAICFWLPLHADWQRPILNYTRAQYAAGGQNWMVAQHPNGWLYFANNKGLLEFDGELWSTYPMDDEKTRALCIDADSTIYIGGMREFGCFEPNRLGGLDYRRLSDSLTRENRINVVWNILASDNRVYFQTDWEMHCYYKSGDSIRTVPAHRNIKRSALIGGKLYIADAAGLSVLNGDRFLPLPGTQAISSCKVVALLPFMGRGKVLVVTEKNGLFLYDGHTLSRFASAADPFLIRNRLFCAAVDGHMLALGSIQNGVQIVDLEQNLSENISTHNGLQNKTVLSVAFDRNGDLWLGLDNGIDYVRLNSVRADLYGGKPVIGSGYASCLYRGRIYYGTNQGLYRSAVAVDPGIDIRMEQVEPLGGQIWNLNVHGDRLFCAADAGLFIVSATGIEQLPGIRGVWTVVATDRSDRLLAGTYVGLYLLIEENGRWRISHKLDGMNYSCKNLFVENGTVVWTSNKGDGLHRLTLSDDFTTILEQKNYNSALIPKDKGVSFSFIGTDLVIATAHGLFRYNQIKDELEPFPELEARLRGKVPYRLVRQTDDGSIWYACDESLYCLRENCSHTYLRNALVAGFEHIAPLGDNRMIVSTEDGFVSLHIPSHHTPRHSMCVQIRHVFFREKYDSLIYGRSYHHDETPLRIPYSKNTLRFICSASNYASPQHKLYSYRLGNSSDAGIWTEYSENNSKEYTDLHEGNYLFEVRVPELDASGKPIVASLAFRVLPPWYRSPVMYGIYFLLLIAAAVCLYEYAYGRQRAIVRRQQQEMKKKNQEIKHLEEESIRAELQHKTEELARTTLNIVRKNEILQKIRKEAGNILRAAKEEDMIHIRRSTARLIDNIDTNLEHDNDIKHFEETFDSVHRNFFKHLDEYCSTLSKQEKMLCAYIRIGMLSKEIAPLLNISVRGVEISRYRLRKKLGLEEGSSLTAFLQKM